MLRFEGKYETNIQKVLELSHRDGSHPYPIDLNIKNKIDIELPDLKWNQYENKAHKMKIINSGNTVVLTAKWKQGKPFISSGPLCDNYIFSQIHFHWGSSDNEGSEHTVEGHCFPMEMHAVHFKSSYATHKNAHKMKDGLVVVVYLFTIQENSNEVLTPLTDVLPSICEPYSSSHIMPSSLEDFIPSFFNNYFLYWGSSRSAKCDHEILWFVCREPIGISRSQLYNFRKLQGDSTIRPFCGVNPLYNRSLFLVNGTPPLDKTFISVHQNQVQQKCEHVSDVLTQADETFNVIDDDLVVVIPRAYVCEENYLN